MTHLKTLKLRNFRSFDSASFVFRPGINVLAGPNGIGKTNILEAVSLFSPGRGLRRSAQARLQRDDSNEPWAIAAQFAQSDETTRRLGTGRGAQGRSGRIGPRRLRLDGQDLRSQSTLSEIVQILWLTPTMDRLFTGSPARRRDFLDRMTALLIPDHTRQAKVYLTSLKSRAHLLQEDRYDEAWLSALEQKIAAAGTAITAARRSCLKRINHMIQNRDTGFPKGTFQLSESRVMQQLTRQSATTVEGHYRQSLRQQRSRPIPDFGPHRDDMTAVFSAKNQDSSQSSTGEQKALLMNALLSLAALSSEVYQAPPILLLDEVAAHFDPSRYNALFTLLTANGMQCLVTGVDKSVFSGIDTAEFIIL